MPSVLVDRYELRARIGSGGMATVWGAFDRRLAREVAVKVLSENLVADETFRRRFEREAHHIASLTHPNIVVVHDFGADDDQLFIVMELVKGKSLRQLLTESSPLTAPAVTRLATDILAGLSHAHEAGILHRDIKPGNILVTDSGVSKLADFGIAKATEETVDLTDTGAILGTVSYASPEQLSGSHLGPASDLYSLGCVLYECLAGRPPFVADNIAALVSQQQFAAPEPLRDVSPEAPAGLCAPIMRALEKDPGKRFDGAGEMKQHLGGSDAEGPGRCFRAPVEEAFTRSTIESPGVGAIRSSDAIPPSGTVTLLFTDIEGSTRLWEEEPDAMAIALRRHEELMRSHVEGAGGYVFKIVGDAFRAAFATAKEAVQAASRAQRAIFVEPWPPEMIVKVRMALHTGECEERDGDYYGQALNRVARLEAIAHGGQVILSRATTDVVRDQLPVGVNLRDLGTHRLKDLGRPEEVFQLEIEGLNADFPPLNSLDNPEFQHNLPEQASSFVGREGDLIRLRGLLDDARIVTLTGPGGVGKTRLALQVAAELVDGSGQGAWFVDLAPIDDQTMVALTVANTLGVREERGRPVLASIVGALRDRDVLIVLDNCEHVIEASASLAEQLVQGCGRVSILATSREPLGIAGEHVFRVPSLSLPAADEDDLDRLAESEAVRLFATRTTQHKPDFSLSVANAATVGRLCHRLDGIPLAIELAVARLRSMSLGDIEHRLDERFRVLTGGSRTSLPRQRTLQALIDWSYDLLSASEQDLLCCLSVFAGGFDLDAAEAIIRATDVERVAVFEVIGALVDKSLVQVDETTSGSATVRYRLLETIRDYASTKLAERGAASADAVRRAHRDHYLNLAEIAELHLDGRDQIEWLDRFEREHDNLRAALSYCLGDPDGGLGLRLGAALASFWHYRGYGVEGADILSTHLDRPSNQEKTLLRGRALTGSGLLLAVTGAYLEAMDRGREAISIARAKNDDHLVAEALQVFAVARYRQGEFGEALPVIEEGLALAFALGDERLAGPLLSMKAVALDQTGENGLSSYNEALALFRKTGNRIRASTVLNNIACREIDTGDLDDAWAHLTEVLEYARALGDRELVSFATGNLGLVAYLRGEDASARERFTESLDIARRNGYQSQLGYALLGLALTATRTDDFEHAAIIHGFIDSLFVELVEQLQAPESHLREADHLRLRSKLGDTAFDLAYSAGGVLGTDEAVTLARS